MPRPKKISRRVPDVLTITQEEYDRLREAIAKVQSNRPNVDDPIMAADGILNRCINGRDAKGGLWWNAPYDLKGRLRPFGFNLDTMEGIPGFWENRGRKKGKKTDWAPIDVKKGVPKEVEQEGVAINVDAIGVPVSNDEKKEYNRRLRAYMKHFPHLDNPADQALLEQLVRLEIMSIRRLDSVLQNRSTSGMSGAIDRDLADNQRKLQETLGIAGNQRMKLMGTISSGSVAELVVRFEAYTKDGRYLEIEFEWWKEEAALLLRKADRLFPDGEPEISDAVFKRFMGVDMVTARHIIADPYSRNLAEARKRALSLMRGNIDVDKQENSEPEKPLVSDSGAGDGSSGSDTTI
jgi:hypothetical protein